MRYIFTLLIFFSGLSLGNDHPLSDNKVTCEEMDNSPELVFQLLDLGSGKGSPNEVDYFCPKSLTQLNFLKGIIEQANSIREPGNLSQYCTGTLAYAQRRYYLFSLAQLGYFPQGYSLKNSGKINGMEYFKEWSYKSLYNRNVYTNYIQEIESAKPKLVDWYIKNHSVDTKTAKKYTRIALHRISSYGFGSYFYNWKPEPLIPFTEDVISGNSSQFLSAVSGSSEQQKFNTLRRLLTHEAPTKLIKKLVSTMAIENPAKRSESIISSSVTEPLNLEVLLDAGFEIDHQNEFGKTALFYAIQFNQHGSVRSLLKNGANVNHTYQQEQEDKWNCTGVEQWGRTPLMHAAQHSDIEMLNTLLNKGANIKAKDVKGFTAYDYAKNNDKQENARFIKKKLGA